MRQPWFEPWGWGYRPVAWPGYLIWLGAAAFGWITFVAVDRHSHSVSDTLYGLFPYWVPALLLVERIAARSSGARCKGER
jgi:hypothetical protein